MTAKKRRRKLAREAARFNHSSDPLVFEHLDSFMKVFAFGTDSTDQIILDYQAHDALTFLRHYLRFGNTNWMECPLRDAISAERVRYLIDLIEKSYFAVKNKSGLSCIEDFRTAIGDTIQRDKQTANRTAHSLISL